MNDMIEGVLAGNRRIIARALTIVENADEGMDELLDALFPHTGKAWIIGITGAPGTGKSSLVNAMTRAYRAQGKRVGVVAVDPTSPFSGGAILGDRIRMREHSGDRDVFIRSMATRGSLGGLARATRDSIRVLDAAGFDIILVETVGAGQSEVEIVRTAQTTLVVEAPGLGDDVQAIKAGILEIADILVVNKADHPGTRNTVRALTSMLELGHPASRLRLVDHHGILEQVEEAPLVENDALWIPPVVETVATEFAGIDRLLAEIDAHRGYLLQEDIAVQMERQRLKIELLERLREALMQRLLQQVTEEDWSAWVDAIQSRKIAPQRAVQNVLKDYHKQVN